MIEFRESRYQENEGTIEIRSLSRGKPVMVGCVTEFAAALAISRLMGRQWLLCEFATPGVVCLYNGFVCR